jgi:hypothetical protein
MSQRFINIIRHYKRWKAVNPDSCILHCANQPTLRDAIIKAALSVDHLGKKHPHQYRLKREDLQNFGNALVQNAERIENAINFEEIISYVRSCKIYGIGELAIYDTAVRIGAFLDIWPDRIYLHAGAKVGALAVNPNISADVITKNDLPLAFQAEDLSCYELEDILCIYKKMFLHAARN